jgi:chemotaxis protein CheX
MLDEQLATVIEDITGTLFGVPIHRAPLTAGSFDDHALTGRIEYHGVFSGALSLCLSEPLARTLATLMLQNLRGRCSEGDVHDAIGELANIAAGNLRGLLSGDCQVSLPSVRRAPIHDGVEHSPILSHADFMLFEEPLSVELRGRVVSR